MNEDHESTTPDGDDAAGGSSGADRSGSSRPDKARDADGNFDPTRSIGPTPRDDSTSHDPGAGPDFENLLGNLMGGSSPGGFDLGALGSMLPGGPAQLGEMMAGLQAMMSGATSDSSVNWDLARQTARRVAAQHSDPTPSDAQGRAARDNWILVNGWLDDVTDMPAAASVLQSWSRADWVEASMDTWAQITEPIAESIGAAMHRAMTEQAPPEMAAMLSGATGMLRGVAGGLFGSQVGQAVGTLAGELLSTFDIGLPLTSEPDAALIMANVDAFADGLDVPTTDVALYVSLREAAHHRLYESATWLRAEVFDALESYARGITIDTAAMEQQMRDIDPTNPAALQEALNQGAIKPTLSAQQQTALARLELLLALIEGWVDHACHQAASGRMPTADALRETMRRRRAAGGPAEHVLANLVGLELRPRRLRDAAALWAMLESRAGRDARDGMWSHPDLMPTLADLDEPTDGAARLLALHKDLHESDLDEELRKLLDSSDE